MSDHPTTTKPAQTTGDPRLQQVRALVRRAEKRFRLQEATSLFPWAIAVAAGIVVLLAALRRYSGWFSLDVLLLASAGVVAASLTAVALYSLFRPRELLATARRADRLLGLDERLSTALEDVASKPAKPTAALLALRNAQLDDAVQSVSHSNPERDLQLKLDRRRMLPSAGLAVVLLAVLFVPNFGASSGEKATSAQVAVEQKNIEILKQAIEAQPRAAQDPTLQKLLQELSALSHDLKEGNLSKEEALARLAQTESDLQKALDPQTAAQREALDQLAKQLSASGNEAAKEAGDALKAGDSQKAADDLKKAAGDVSKMPAQDQKALADTLRKARDSAAALDPDLASRLNDAASALESPDPKAAEQALNNLAQKIEENGQKLATQQQVEQALSQIQQSKSNIAQSGQATPVVGGGTAVANVTPGSGTPSSGTPVSGTPGTAVGNSTAVAGTALAGTAVTLGTPLSGTVVAVPSGTALAASGTIVAGQASGTGTPVLVQGTQGQGTPVLAQGQGQGQGQGQQGQGQGQNPGQGQGQSQGQSPGQGQGQGQTQGQSGGQGQGQGQNGSGQKSGQPTGGWGTGHQEQVYSPPSSVNANLTPVTVQGQNNPNGEQSSTSTNTDANNAGSSLVPYEQIYGQYKEQAGNAMDSDYIPQGYKDLVKGYFSDIAP